MSEMGNAGVIFSSASAGSCPAYLTRVATRTLPTMLGGMGDGGWGMGKYGVLG